MPNKSIPNPKPITPTTRETPTSETKAFGIVRTTAPLFPVAEADALPEEDVEAAVVAGVVLLTTAFEILADVAVVEVVVVALSTL